MTGTAERNDWLTITALALAAMCVVTFDHEVLGHGSACLLFHGQIRLVTSSVFRCSARSGWIDPAGPATNLLMGALALVCRLLIPRRMTKLRLLLILVTAFSFFWEAGYVIRAMLKRDGDLYFFAQFMLGDDVPPGVRWAAAGAGLVLYVVAGWITSAALQGLWPQARMARAVARTAWLSATVGATLAALAFSGPHGGPDWGNVRDGALEIGAASFPLLFLPPRDARLVGERAPAIIARSPAVIVLGLAVYALFVVTQGRGLVF